jgi:hypothetical protein
MKQRPLVVAFVLALAAPLAGVALLACQGGENVLPLPPSDASAETSSDAASADGGSKEASAASDASSTKDNESAETGVEAGTQSEAGTSEEGSAGEAGATEGGADAPYDSTPEE